MDNPVPSLNYFVLETNNSIQHNRKTQSKKRICKETIKSEFKCPKSPKCLIRRECFCQTGSYTFSKPQWHKTLQRRQYLRYEQGNHFEVVKESSKNIRKKRLYYSSICVEAICLIFGVSFNTFRNSFQEFIRGRSMTTFAYSCVNISERERSRSVLCNLN